MSPRATLLPSLVPPSQSSLPCSCVALPSGPGAAARRSVSPLLLAQVLNTKPWSLGKHSPVPATLGWGRSLFPKHFVVVEQTLFMATGCVCMRVSLGLGQASLPPLHLDWPAQSRIELGFQGFDGGCPAPQVLLAVSSSNSFYFPGYCHMLEAGQQVEVGVAVELPPTLLYSFHHQTLGRR